MKPYRVDYTIVILFWCCDMQVEEAEKEKQVQSTAIAEEQQRLEEELAALETRQQQGSASLARHCDDIDMKISSTQGDLTTSRNARQELQRFADDIQTGQRRRKQQLKDADSSAALVLREELEELEMQQLQLQIELDDIEKKIKADSVLLKRYREHKTELQARVQRGGEHFFLPHGISFLIDFVCLLLYFSIEGS